MKLTEKGKRNLVNLIVIFLVVCVGLTVLLIWQISKINSLNAEINTLNENNNEVLEELATQEEQIEYFESEGYKEEFLQKEYEKSEGDIVFK